jgi:hypothetical protein|tara:strand:- start:7254 stop:7376 length:123 start_codon:yes stop_codon:yes gene_type:complete
MRREEGENVEESDVLLLLIYFAHRSPQLKNVVAIAPQGPS